MHFSDTYIMLSVLLCSSLTLAAPATSPVDSAAKAAPTCKTVKINFDELGNAGGHDQYLPKNGYDYKGLDLAPGQWRWVSQGLSENGDFTDNDGPVAVPSNEQIRNIVTHSGKNALINAEDGFVQQVGAANYAGGHRFYDLKSLWIRPEYPGAFNYRLDCRANREKNNVNKTFAVPKLSGDAFYKITPPSTFKHLWRCTQGSLKEQQVTIDDIEICLWDFPYAVPIPADFQAVRSVDEVLGGILSCREARCRHDEEQTAVRC